MGIEPLDEIQALTLTLTPTLIGLEPLPMKYRDVQAIQADKYALAVEHWTLNATLLFYFWQERAEEGNMMASGDEAVGESDGETKVTLTHTSSTQTLS